MTNKLFYGDNLDVLREHIASDSVDLIYLDPPFNSNANYNILFKSKTGDGSDAQIEAFEDTWHWNDHAEDAFDHVIRSGNTAAAELLRAMRGFLGENDMMAYLAMMAIRLIELHRVLKPTGSLYLHCDPTASHYLKLLLDSVFGGDKFVNEIIWKRSHAHSDAKQGAKHFGRLTDTILFYSKSPERTWNVLFTEYDQKYVDRDYRRIDPDGRRFRLDNIQGPGGADKGNPFYEVMGVSRHWRYSKDRMQKLIDEGRIIQTRPGAVPQYKRYLDEMPGVPLQNLWADLPIINNRSDEGLGYPTQKPLALLERIIAVSSDPGDVVLDPFCGCGTAIHAAQKLGRQWIGIDITHLAISLIEKRLKDAFPGIQFEVHGTPKDLASAQDLAIRDKYQFQWWAVSMGGRCATVRRQKEGCRRGHRRDHLLQTRRQKDREGAGFGQGRRQRLGQHDPRSAQRDGARESADRRVHHRHAANAPDGDGSGGCWPVRGRVGADLSEAANHHVGRAVPRQEAGHPLRRSGELKARETGGRGCGEAGEFPVTEAFTLRVFVPSGLPCLPSPPLCYTHPRGR